MQTAAGRFATRTMAGLAWPVAKRRALTAYTTK